MRIPFRKMNGAGNDFVVLDWRSGVRAEELAALAPSLCDRRRGIGADGILYLAPGERADVRVHYLNADGSDAGMCGNGARCAAVEAARLGLGPADAIRMDFGGIIVRGDATMRGKRVSVALGAPRSMPRGMTVTAAGREWALLHADTGVPHAVVAVEDVAAVDVDALGRTIRAHPALAPAGANVDFVERRGAGPVPMRTYERGVEAETLACGTGAAAVALVAVSVWGRTPPIDIATRGGEILTVHVAGSPAAPADLVLEGSATLVFTGDIDIDTTRPAPGGAPEGR